MAKWQRVNIKVSKNLGPRQREAVGLEIIEHIKKRTSQGKDKDGRPWTGKAAVYSKSYRQSLDFKIAKGRSSKVNLELSSEMMNSIKIISHRSGSLIVGYDKSNSELNGKVEGNRLGTYGKSSPVGGKARDFLGIEKDKLSQIEKSYDPKINSRQEIKERAENIKNILG